MLLIMLAFSLVLGLLLLDVIAYLPLNLLALFQPPRWLILSIVFVIAAWCMGESD
jgi:hypothetical protein